MPIWNPLIKGSMIRVCILLSRTNSTLITSSPTFKLRYHFRFNLHSLQKLWIAGNPLRFCKRGLKLRRRLSNFSKTSTKRRIRVTNPSKIKHPTMRNWPLPKNSNGKCVLRKPFSYRSRTSKPKNPPSSKSNLYKNPLAKTPCTSRPPQHSRNRFPRSPQ